MTDPHDRFETWLAEATPGDPPRDLALHASGCGECLARAAAVDALRGVDPGLAPDPPIVAGEVPRPAGLVSMARAGAGFAAVALLGAAVLIGTGALLADRSPATGGGQIPAASAGEGVLGAAGGPELAPEGATVPPATPTAQAEGSPDAGSPSPSGTIAPVAPVPPGPTTIVTTPGSTPRPVTPPPPSTPTPAPPIPTPTPTAAPTATASPSQAPTATTAPSPSQAPTPAPTDTATPTPSPTPSDQTTGLATPCTNGVDDDGDLLIDELDPGCQLGVLESDF